MVWAGDGERDRALSQACDGSRCGAWSRHEGDEPVRLTFEGDDGGAAAARAWLLEPLREGPTPGTPWYERWELWVSVGAALLVGAAIATGVGIDYAQQASAPNVTIVDEFSNP